MKKHLISALRSERRRNYTMNASIVSAVFMIMIWAGLLTGFIMIGIKRCLHFLSPLQMPFVFLIVGLVVSVIIGTCISAAVASKIVGPVREVKKAMHRVEKGDFSQRLEVTGFNGEIDELIESYNKMAQELGGIEMFRENFINSFSHEFKTPIVSIQGFAKQLKKENLSEEKKEAIAEQLLEDMHARTVIKNQDGNLYTVYAYSPCFSESVRQGTTRVNLALTMYYNSRTQQTEICAAVPAIGVSGESA